MIAARRAAAIVGAGAGARGSIFGLGVVAALIGAHGLACDGGRAPDAPNAASAPAPERENARPASADEGAPRDMSERTGIEATATRGAEAAAPAATRESSPPATALAPALALPPAPDGTPAIACEDAPEGMACIAAGPFLRGRDDGPENARPAATVWLQTFYIDLNEVTYAEYKACVKARRCPVSGPAYTDFDRPRQPINGISWHDAVAYCAYRGKRLPTEAQWEKAARGDSGELHPWGDEPATCERAIIRDQSGRGCGVRKSGSKPETGRPWEVGSRPAYRHGLFDMAGNSWEWVADWYSRSYAECGDACLGVDPKGPCGGADECPGHARKIVRGGSWYWPAEYATSTYRRAHVPNNRPFHHFGFRCAATIDEAAALRAQAAGEPASP